MKKADLANRIVAAVLDSLVLSFVNGILMIPVYCLVFPLAFATSSVTTTGRYGYAVSSASNGASGLLACCVLLVVFLIEIAVLYVYYIYLPVKKWRGATIGKHVMKIRVVKTDGKDVTMSDMFMREIVGKFVSGLVFYLGYLWILIDEKGQGWHDKIANTWVVEGETKEK